MSITTEEAEQMAEICDQLGGFAQCAAAIRSLAAERDALQAEKVNIQDDLASVERERAHQHGRADRNAAEYAREQKKREQLQAENARLREALDFYACVDHYQIHNAAAPNVVQFDRGAKARAARGEKE